MTNKKTLAIAVAALAVVLAALIWGLRSDVDHAPASDDAATAEQQVRQPAEVAPPRGEPLAPAEQELTRVEEAGERVPEAPAAPAEPIGPRGPTIHGRFQFPAGTPADERVVVLAVDEARNLRRLVDDPDLVGMAWDPERQRTHALVATVDVAADGSFELALPIGTETAHLAVSGRYAFSMATTEVELPAPGVTTLTGELGGWVTGTLLPPPDPGPLESDFEWIDVELGPDMTSGFDTSRIATLEVTRRTQAVSDGSFEFRGIPSAGSYGISVHHGHLAALLRLGIDPEPGEHLALKLPMVRGATVSGRVVDDGGAPIADAAVEARWRGVVGEAVGALRKTVSAEDGSFELEHVAIGRITLVARLKGRLEARQKLDEELLDGGIVGDVTLMLGAGGSIAGRVEFADGSPAVDAKVHAGPDLSRVDSMNAMSLARTKGGDAKSDADGRFELEGLSASTFEVTARLDREDGERAGRWKATAKGIDPGGPPVVLVLEGLLPIAGRVVDAQEDPVTSFTVQATRQGSGMMMGFGAERLSQTFDEAADGKFEMDGFVPAVWEVRVTADGFASSEMLEAHLPRAADASELLFRLQAAAGIAGKVLDTADAPVAGASVTLELDLGSRMRAMQNGGIPEVFTDAGGEFELQGLDPGPVSLVASLEGFAASEPSSSTVAAGQTTSGIVLQLRTGGSLTGIVYDDEGEPAPGRMVIVQAAPNYAKQHMLSSDGRGEFAVEHLEPGSWQVVATENFMSGDSSLMDGESDMGSFLGSMKMAAVQIVEGEEAHVVLGAPPADPVLLSGHVTHAGAPVPGAMVALAPEGPPGADAMSGIKMKMTDQAGAFEVRLDKPGGYRVTVQTGLSMGRQNAVEYMEEIPADVEAHDLEIELPGGRISGMVRGPHGAPLADCRVTVTVEGGVAYGSLMGGNYAEVKTDENGRYDVGFLRAGSYVVAAGGVPLGGMLGGDSKGGREVRAGVRLAEGQWLDSLDFHLQEPASISGTVRDPSGAPVAGAGIFVRDDSGQLLERFSLIATDGAGRFTYSGMAAGRYRISARKDDQVTGESAAVRVAPGEVGEVDLTLVQGTVLRIEVVDDTDAHLNAVISVTDADGHELSGMLSMADLTGASIGGFSSEEHRVGPLPDGKYIVKATHADGRTKSRSVHLSGQGERKVKLRLD